MADSSLNERRRVTSSPRFELVEVVPADESLFLGFYCDADRMKHLGGAMSAEAARVRFSKWINQWKSQTFGTCLVQTKGIGETVGVVALFLTEIKGETVYEIGWMVLKEFEKRGVAFEASKAYLDFAIARLGAKVITAFPSEKNLASNRICEKLGMKKLETISYPYGDGILHSVHWRLSL